MHAGIATFMEVWISANRLSISVVSATAASADRPA